MHRLRHRSTTGAQLDSLYVYVYAVTESGSVVEKVEGNSSMVGMLEAGQS